MDKQVGKLYETLNGSEKKVANRLIKVLATEDLDSKNIRQINRAIGRKDTTTKKRPSGYILFYKEQYPLVKGNNPELKTLGDIAKNIGTTWSSMSDEDKSIYNEKAKNA